MTRRKFVRKLIAAGSAIVGCASWLGRKAAPQRFVRAVRAKKYPGVLKPLRDITGPGKWGG